MPRHSTIATALDKHKISSSVAYLVLLEVTVIDPDSNVVVDIVRIANNNETYQWQGNSYYPTFFEVDCTFEQDKLPTVSVNFRDFHGVIQAQMQAYKGLTGSNVRMIVVNASVPNNPPELDETFTVTSAKANASDYTLTFTLGAENPIGLRFPPFMAFRDRCRWLYKGVECAYTGTLPTCDYTLKGTNGCEVHGNTLRFGAYPGIKAPTF